MCDYEIYDIRSSIDIEYALKPSSIDSGVVLLASLGLCEMSNDILLSAPGSVIIIPQSIMSLESRHEELELSENIHADMPTFSYMYESRRGPN